MSRSFKHQPFMAVCGNGSAKQDKVMAHRGVRRTQKAYIRSTFEYEDFLLPHRLECPWNETYSWGRDGHQTWHGVDDWDWQRYLKHGPLDKHYGVWPPRWYARMMRK
jgi:hypothetical protein